MPQNAWKTLRQAGRTVAALRTVLAALSLGLLVAAPATARGAELITIEDECRGQQLLVKGAIEPGDFERIRDRLSRLAGGDDLPDVQDPETLWTVNLDSGGGDVAEAMRIGRLLRGVLATTDASYRFARGADGIYDFERSGDTVCLNGDGRLGGCSEDVVKAECAGACLLIWLAGANRFAHEGHLGVHGLEVADPDSVAAYLEDMNVPRDWIARLSAASIDGPSWLSWPERQALSGQAAALENLLANCPAPLTADEAFDSITAASDQLREALLDRAEAHRRCRVDRVAAARAPVLDALLRARPATPL